MSRCNHISFPDAEFYLMNLFLMPTILATVTATQDTSQGQIAKAIKDRMKECINGAEAERPIGTFAFFDLEATGLPGKSTR